MASFANNNLTAAELWKLRRIYDDLYSSMNPEYFDFRGKRLFYGKVDYDFDAVMVRESKLLRFNQKKEMRALNFVVDAFEDLKKYLQACKARFPDAFSPPEDHFLNTMEVKRAWVNSSNAYAELMRGYNLLFFSAYVPERNLEKDIKSVNDYIKNFLEFYKGLKGAFPISRSTFNLTSLTSPNASGLCVELSTDDHSDDTPKVEDFFSDKYFGFYVKSAAKFGFMIDENAPWRLVANFSSPQMGRYMWKYGVSKSTIFQKCYRKIYVFDIEIMRTYMINYYNSFAEAIPITQVPVPMLKKCLRKTTTQTTRRNVFIYNRRINYVDEPYLKDDFWMREYYSIRALETKTPIGKFKLLRELKKIANLKKYFDIFKAIDYINREMRYTLRPASEYEKVINVFQARDFSRLAYGLTKPPLPNALSFLDEAAPINLTLIKSDLPTPLLAKAVQEGRIPPFDSEGGAGAADGPVEGEVSAAGYRRQRQRDTRRVERQQGLAVVGTRISGENEGEE